jgi:hypothetical protein
VFDREHEDDHVEETNNVEEMNSNATVSEIVDEITMTDVVAETAEEHAEVETVDFINSAETVDFINSAEVVEIVEDVETVDITEVDEIAEVDETVESISSIDVVEYIEDAITTDIADVEPDREMSNVVSLFGRERIAPVLPEVSEIEEEAQDTSEAQGTVETPAEDTAEDTEETTAPRTTVNAGKVDDIFARLRADSTAHVAEAVIAKVQTVDPALFAERDEALSSLVVQFSRKLKRVLADEQNTVLEHLRKKRSALEIEAMLGSIEDHAQRYCDAIADEMMKAAAAGAKSMKAFGGSSRRIVTKDLNAIVHRAIANSLVAKFREDTRIAVGEAEGDRDILASLMRDVYRQWKMASLDENVDDIACAAFSCGAYFSLESGITVSWIVNPTQACCAECDDNALADNVTVGTEFPTGHRHPLAHTGCRCLVCPISH